MCHLTNHSALHLGPPAWFDRHIGSGQRRRRMGVVEGHLSCSKERWEGLNIAYWCEERRTFREKTNTLAIAREKKCENTSGNGKTVKRFPLKKYLCVFWGKAIYRFTIFLWGTWVQTLLCSGKFFFQIFFRG